MMNGSRLVMVIITGAQIAVTALAVLVFIRKGFDLIDNFQLTHAMGLQGLIGIDPDAVAVRNHGEQLVEVNSYRCQHFTALFPVHGKVSGHAPSSSQKAS